MATMLSSGFADLMAPGLFDVISTNYKQYPDEYSKILNVKTSKKQYEKSTTIENVAAAPEKSKGEAVNFAVLTQGYDTTSTHKTYAQGCRVEREAYDDDLYSIFRDKLGQYLARSMKQRAETIGANVFNNAFSTSYLGGDGHELLDTNHPFASGSTYQNEPTAAVDLSQTSLEDMFTLLESATEANSMNIQLIPKMLLVPPALRWTASVLLESQLKSGTANNDKNPFLDLDVNYMVDHYLSDSDAWFVLSDAHSLIFWERQRPKLEADDDFDTGDAKVKITARYSTQWESPLGVVGSPGV